MDKNKFNQMSTIDIAKELIKTAERKVKLEAEVSNVNKDLSFINTVLADRFLDEEVKVLLVDDLKLTFETQQQFSLNKEMLGDEDLKWDDENSPWFEWLKEVKEDGLIKTTKSVHNATRTKFLKEWIEKEKPLPNFIKLNYWNRVKYNQAEVKRRANNGSA